MTGVCLVVVGKRAVKGVLSRRELYWHVIAPVSGIRIIKATVVSCPLFVPGARAIGDEIISAWLLSDPEEGRYDVLFPRETLSRFRRSS